MRKIIQVATYPEGTLIALCDDGSVWELRDAGWVQVNVDKVTGKQKEQK